jgi:glycosyltransferase involved in cell wall biosynthesis
MCKALENMGHVVKIAVAGSREDVERYFGGRAVRIFLIKKKFLRIFCLWTFGYIKFLWSYFVFKPELIILDIYTFLFSAPFVFFSKTAPVFIVDNKTPYYGKMPGEVRLEDRIMRVYTSICYKYTKRFLNGITVITDYYKERLCEKFQFNPDNVGVWSSGVNLELFSPEKYKHHARLSFLEGKFVLMQHGEISYNRGLFELIEAIGKVNKPDICLVLVGKALGSGGVKEQLVSLAEKLKLKDKIYILPPVSHEQIPAYISYCDCAVMAYPNIEYWNNNSPVKMFEYLAMGKVIICTDMPAFRSVMGDKKCACYIKDNASQTLAEAIRYCYENKSFLREWGETGIGIVRADYTYDKQVKHLMSFIEKIKR